MASGFDRPVTVYAFRCYDLDAGGFVVPPFKATEPAIRNHFHGHILSLTAEEVDPDELDDEGRWFRIATGWGSLG